jgi:hypothetical protein
MRIHREINKNNAKINNFFQLKENFKNLKLIKMSFNAKNNSKKSVVREIEICTSMEDLSEVPPSEDLPPSYALAVFRECVEKTMTNENIIPKVVTTQPSITSTNLSHRLSLISTEFTLNLPKPEPLRSMRPISTAWSDKIVIKNVHERDRITLFCFCASTLSALMTLTFYCTS